MNQNTSSKDFWKPSVLVWHGLNTNVSQIKKKKVGAWPLCFFLIVAYMIYVFHFSFDISLRKKIFFLWCHTNTHGIDLRRTPQKWNGKKTAPGSMSSVVITWHSVSLCSYLKSSYDDTTLGKAMLPVLVKCILIIGAKNTTKYKNTNTQIHHLGKAMLPVLVQCILISGASLGGKFVAEIQMWKENQDVSSFWGWISLFGHFLEITPLWIKWLCRHGFHNKWP